MSPNIAHVTVAVVLVSFMGPVPSTAQLRPATTEAFTRYVQLTESRIADEVDGRSPFLWVDRQPAAQRARLLERLRNGEVVSDRLETRDGRSKIGVDDGMIHHWIGTVLIPDVSVAEVREFVQDYPRYPAHFTPLIQRTNVVDRRAESFRVHMRTWMKKVITVVVDADYVVDYHHLDATRMYSRSEAHDIHIVEDADSSGEQRVPADETDGLLWRLNTYCSFEQRAEGTYEQCESVSLTRGIPLMLRWLISPFVTGIPRETLAFTLGQVRERIAAR